MTNDNGATTAHDDGCGRDHHPDAVCNPEADAATDIDPRLRATELFDSKPTLAQKLWDEMFRPILGQDLRKGMVAAITSTDPFLHNPTGEIVTLTVLAVGEDDDGDLYVEHAGGATEVEEHTEVWVDQTENDGRFDGAIDNYDRYLKTGSPDVPSCAICDEPIDEPSEAVEMAMPDTEPGVVYRQVVCEDGQVRHAAPFATQAEAATFMEWGHCCTRNHTVEPVLVEGIVHSHCGTARGWEVA